MEEDLASFWSGGFQPKDRSAVYDWLGKYWELSAPLTETGKFDVYKSRHLIGPFDSFQNEFKREINVLAPVRGAKSLFADGAQLWTMAIRPGPMLYLFQDEKAVKDHAEARTWKNIEKCQPVNAMLSSDRHMNRTLDIIFPHMLFHMRGPAQSNLQSRGYQNVFVDEPWQYKNGKIEEARGRLGDFAKKGTDKFVCLSQGGESGQDWDYQFNTGIIHEWHIQCMSCGHYMLPVWNGYRADGTRWGMKFDGHKLPNGLWNVAKTIPTVRFECEKCAYPHIWSGRTKTEWNRTGKYVAEITDSKLITKDSFHWTAVIDYPWDQLLDIFLKAINGFKHGSPDGLIQFYQKRMGEMCSMEKILENSLNFSKGEVYEVSSKPKDAILLLTADRQEEDLYWVMACDWFPTTPEKVAHVRRVWYGKCYSAAEIEKKREEFGVLRNHVLIDSGFRAKGDQGVYAHCIQYGWIPTKGDAADTGEPIWFTHMMGKGVRVQKSYSEPVIVDSETKGMTQMIRFSAPTYTALVQDLIDNGRWIEPDSDAPMDKECRKQMAAEFLREITVGNKDARRTKKVWVCPSRNNHARDCAKMQGLGARVLGILPDTEDEGM